MASVNVIIGVDEGTEYTLMFLNDAGRVGVALNSETRLYGTAQALRELGQQFIDHADYIDSRQLSMSEPS